jgi:hypothetical protein
MKESREHLIIKKELEAIKALLYDLTERLNKLEYSGEVEFGEPYNVGRSKKHVNISLRKNEEEKT